MRVALPHQLGREEVRRRLNDHSHEIAGMIPGGFATVDTAWPDEDQMDLNVNALGQRVKGRVDIFEDQVVIELDLPAALGMARSAIEKAVRSNAQKMLEKK